MPTPTNLPPVPPPPRNAQERLEPAAQLYREFTTHCFWLSQECG